MTLHEATDPAQLLRLLGRTEHENGQHSREAVEWEPPRPLHDDHRPTFPIDALRGFESFERFVRALAEFTQTPIDLPATVALGTLSAAAGGAFEVEVEPGYIEPVHLFLLTLLQSGSRKSAVLRECTRPVVRVEKERAARDRKERDVWESRRRVKEKTLAHIETTLAAPERTLSKGGAPIDVDALSLQAEAIARELASDRPPRVTQLIADDLTSERLGNLIAEQDGALAVMSAEGGFFGNIGGRYHGMPSLDTLTKAHAGDELRVQRMGRLGEIVPRPALTICVAAQPEIAGELGRIPGFRGKGAAARFLVSMPPSNLGRRKASVEPLSPHVVAEWDRAVARILDMAPTIRDADDGYPIPHRLHVSQRAREMHLAFREEVEVELSETGLFADVTDWGSKLSGAVARIAGLLHLLATPEGQEPDATPIAEMTMQAAITIADYFSAHALVYFDALGGGDDGELSAARIVLDELRALVIEHGGVPVSKRALHQRLRNRKRFTKAASLDAPLNRLEAHGYIAMVIERPEGNAGGRSSTIVHLNPLAQNTQNAQKSQKGARS